MFLHLHLSDFESVRTMSNTAMINMEAVSYFKQDDRRKIVGFQPPHAHFHCEYDVDQDRNDDRLV